MIEQIRMGVPLLVQENKRVKGRLSCKNFWQYLEVNGAYTDKGTAAGVAETVNTY